MEPDKPVVAAFDFDKTITDRDTTLLFLLYSAGFVKTTLYILRKLPKLIAFLLGLAPRQETKEDIFKIFFYGKSQEQMQRLAKSFARDVIPKVLRPKALERIEWHKKKGHRLILVSASLDLYLEPWAKSHGFECVLSSRLAVNSGKITGKLKGLNCRGHEKVRRLQECLGDLSRYTIFAYGDSDGDKELLKIADYPHYRRL